MEKIDVIGLALLVVAVFTFINILAIGSLFKVVEILKDSLVELTNLIDKTVDNQNNLNVKQGQLNIKIADELGEIVKCLGKLANIKVNINNDASSTGGQ